MWQLHHLLIRVTLQIDSLYPEKNLKQSLHAEETIQMVIITQNILEFTPVIPFKKTGLNKAVKSLGCSYMSNSVCMFWWGFFSLTINVFKVTLNPFISTGVWTRFTGRWTVGRAAASRWIVHWITTNLELSLLFRDEWDKTGCIWHSGYFI